MHLINTELFEYWKAILYFIAFIYKLSVSQTHFTY